MMEKEEVFIFNEKKKNFVRNEDDRSEEDIDVWYVVELDDEDEDGYHVLGVDSMDPEELEELREGE